MNLNTDPKFALIRELIHQINDFCCQNWRDPELYKTTSFWEELTSSKNHQLLEEWVTALGSAPMNPNAAKFYQDTITESKRRVQHG